MGVATTRRMRREPVTESAADAKTTFGRGGEVSASMAFRQAFEHIINLMPKHEYDADLLRREIRTASGYMGRIVRRLTTEYSIRNYFVAETLKIIAIYSDNKTARLNAVRALTRDARKDEIVDDIKHGRLVEIRDRTEYADVRTIARRLVGVL